MTKSEQNKIDAIKLLISCGFEEDGYSGGDTIRTWSNALESPVLMHIPERARLKRGEWKVTVGKITVCFYQIVNHEATNFTNKETKDIDGIKGVIDSL